MKQRSIRVTLLGIFVCVSVAAHADHPVDVEQFSARGEHFKAMTAFERVPEKRITIGAKIAAAKSAWALGLLGWSARLHDEVLRTEKLSLQTRIRLLVSRGAIELQEERYDEAALFAEKAVDLAKDNGALLVPARILWGDALLAKKSYGSAEARYEEALAKAHTDEMPEVHFRLGKVRFLLGRYEESKRSLELVPLEHDRATTALRYLARIALESKDYSAAEFWLSQGREAFNDHFIDSWTDNGLVRASLGQKQPVAARKALENASARYPELDAWLVISEAAYEEDAWKGIHEAARKPKGE